MGVIEAARKNMVDCQLIPGGIVDADLLDRYRNVERHQLMRDQDAELAYSDDCGVMSPLCEAKIVQALTIKPTHVALVVGDGVSPLAGMLSFYVQTVFLMTSGKTASKQAEKACIAQDMCNIVPFIGDLNAVGKDFAPYDLIVSTHACHEVPTALSDALKEGGEMALPIIHQPRQPCELTLYRKNNGVLAGRSLGQVHVPVFGKEEKRHDFVL